MEKPTYKLVGAPCGHHGQYSFYKAIRCTGVAGGQDKVLVIGDFFFVKLWQDSELVSIGELQLLWSDRVSDQTLVSLRLYFLPENTPDGRGAHGQDEVLAINDKVVIRVEDLMSWMCRGDEWHRGLKAVWRGAAPPEPPEPSHAPLHASRLDFSDVEKEKVALEEAEVPGVVVFSYPRYCRYRALLRRLEGVGHGLLRDSLVCALGGYAAPTTNTRILYCKDTFEYPELEGHEFVCNHLAPRLKGRPRGRRRRRARSHSPSPERSPSRTASECSISSEKTEMVTPPRASLRNGSGSNSVEERAADKAFMSQLRTFHRDHSTQLKMAHNLKELSLRALYQSVVRGGGYERVCRDKGWRALHGALQGRPASPSQATLTRRHYERLLLPFEKYERRNGSKWWKLPKLQNGTSTEPESPKQDRKKHIDTTPIATIDISDSPIREIIEKDDKPIPRLRTPSPDHKQEIINLNSSGSDIVKRDEDELPPTHAYDPSNLLTDDTKEFKQAADLNQEFLDSLPKHEPPKDEKPSEPPIKISVKPVEKLIEKPACFMENQSLLASKLLGVEKIPGLTEYLQKQSLTDLSTSLLEIAAKQNAETQSSILAEIASKQSFSEVSNSLLAEIAAKQSLGDTGAGFFRELAQKQTLGEINTSFLAEIAKAQQDLLASSSALSSLTGLSDKLVNYATLAAAGLANGQLPNGTVISVQQGTDKQSKSGDTSGSASPVSRRPAAARSSLRSVRVKPTRSAAGAAAPNTPSATPLRPDSASCSPPVTSSVTPAPPQPTLTNFGINYMPPSALHKHLQPAALHNQVTSTNQLDAHSDDEIIEVPYKPKTPEIIDLDEYESPDSPQAVKKKKLDILKERGLEVTAVTNDWPTPAPGGQPTATPTLAATILQPNPMLLNPAVQQQIMTQAQFFQMYNTIMPQGYTNGLTPPKVIQGKSIYGSPGPEKTVYGNPKDPFMPPPHMLQGAPPLKQPRCLLAEPRPASGPDILDLSSKQEAVQKPAVEIVRIPSVPSPSKPVSSTPPHNLSKSYSLIDGKAVVGSNLEITLVRPRTPQATSPPKTPRPRQKRSSTGQFMSNKTSPSSRESPNYSKAYISPSGIQTSIPTSTSRLVQDMYKSNERAKQATNIVIPNYQMSNSSRDSDVSPTSSTSSRDGNSMVALTSSLLQGGGGSMLQNVSKGSNLAQFVEMQSKNPAQNLAQFVEMQAKSPAQNLAQFMDPSMYMSALYSSLAGQLTPGMPDQHQLAMYQNLISSRLMRNYPGLLNMSSVTSTPTTKN